MRIEAADQFAVWAPLKTWSVVVTILGDLLQSSQDSLSGQALSALVEPMGISNQALRVALHRLRKDGWVESRKTGRNSYYQLSPMGRQARDAVAQRVYGPPALHPREAVLVIAPPGHTASVTEVLGDAAIHLAPRIALTLPPLPRLDPHFLTARLAPGDLPDWAAQILVPKELRADFERFTKLADQARHAAMAQDGHCQTVTRLLVLHHWRRLILRTNPMAETLIGANWEGALARRAAMQTLSDLPCTYVSDDAPNVTNQIAPNPSLHR